MQVEPDGIFIILHNNKLLLFQYRPCVRWVKLFTYVLITLHKNIKCSAKINICHLHENVMLMSTEFENDSSYYWFLN